MGYILVIPDNKMSGNIPLKTRISEKEKPRVELQFLLALLNEPLHQNNGEECHRYVLYITPFCATIILIPLSMISNNVTYT